MPPQSGGRVSPEKPKNSRSTVPPVGPIAPPTGMPPMSGVGAIRPARSPPVLKSGALGSPDGGTHCSVSGKQVCASPEVPITVWHEYPVVQESHGLPQNRLPETS